jgi:uncharacterized protein YecT (DUF1311 family)
LSSHDLSYPLRAALAGNLHLFLLHRRSTAHERTRAPCQKTSGVTLALDNCFARTYRAADDQLNQLYKQIRQVLTPDQQQQLLAAQRLWVQLRDATCRAESDLYKGGDAASPAYSACLEEETRQRTADLKTIYGWVIANSM